MKTKISTTRRLLYASVFVAVVAIFAGCNNDGSIVGQLGDYGRSGWGAAIAGEYYVEPRKKPKLPHMSLDEWIRIKPYEGKESEYIIEWVRGDGSVAHTFNFTTHRINGIMLASFNTAGESGRRDGNRSWIYRIDFGSHNDYGKTISLWELSRDWVDSRSRAMGVKTVYEESGTSVDGYRVVSMPNDQQLIRLVEHAASEGQRSFAFDRTWLSSPWARLGEKNAKTRGKMARLVGR